MRRLLFGSIVGVSATLLVAQGAVSYNYIAHAEQERFITSYERDAFVLSGRVERSVETAKFVDPTLTPLIESYARSAATQVIVVDRNGIGVLTSDATELPVGADYSNRPEIASALVGNVASGERWSDTLGTNLVYVSVPIINGSTVFGAVRLSFPHGEIDAAVANSSQFIWWIAGVALVLATLLSLVVSNIVTRPLRRIQRQAEQLTHGDFSQRLSETRTTREIASLTRAFNVMADQVGALLRQQQAFAGDASHQLRTPLTALLLRIERARTLVLSNPAEATTVLAAAEEEVGRLNAIVEGLLALARAESGLGAPQAVDVAVIAADRVAEWQALAAEHELELRYAGPQTALGRAIPTAVEQIIHNLVDNAMTHSPAGTVVLVRVRSEPDAAVLEVLDSGSGMSVDQCERAFDRFWRADSTTDGTGLGLALVRQLAEASGGSAHLAPRIGAAGLVATVRFPSAR